jgi:urease gamma subunit
MNTESIRAQVLADLKQARGDYADFLERRQGILCGENWVVRIGGFYTRLETDRGRRITKSEATGLIGCSILSERDARAVAAVIRNGNDTDRGECVLYDLALREEIAGLDKMIASIEAKLDGVPA